MLVVEDEALVRMMVVQTLEEAGFAVREAAEAQGALEVLRTDRAIRLMVTDVGLPGLNGRRLADAARVEHPDMKVLFMTGYCRLRPDRGHPSRRFRPDHQAVRSRRPRGAGAGL